MLTKFKHIEVYLTLCLVTALVLYGESVSATSPPDSLSIKIQKRVNDPCDDPDAKGLRILLKTNLLHDIILTPDIGIELGFSPHWSLSFQGQYTWWGDNERHRFWRIAGGYAEIRFWPVRRNFNRTQTGHHIGLYCSIHKFDLEFGGKGYQSSGPTLGLGASYGYSFKIADRLNLDLSMSLGVSDGDIIKYHPECGKYICDRHTSLTRFGVTSVGVSLVWFPGKGKHNIPDINRQ